MPAPTEGTGGGLSRTLTAEFARWETHHPDATSSSVAALESFEARELAQGGLGAWGRLRLLVSMEAQGDHQFDALYQRLSTRYEQWAVDHPARAGSLGIDPAPISTGGTANSTGTSALGNTTASRGAGQSSSSPAQPTASGPSPDSTHPQIVPGNTFGFYSYLCPACARPDRARSQRRPGYGQHDGFQRQPDHG